MYVYVYVYVYIYIYIERERQVLHYIIVCDSMSCYVTCYMLQRSIVYYIIL